ncbi:hypothetical protein [Cohnella sp. GCM10027633]|uniref:hypothetical protein n=1 Tax=unclassified Cohnella TaxID=2636738 RepID=UPI00362E4750
MGTYRHKHRQCSCQKKRSAPKRGRTSPTTGAGNAVAEETQYEDHLHRTGNLNLAGTVGFWGPLWGDDCPPGGRSGGSGSWL